MYELELFTALEAAKAAGVIQMKHIGNPRHIELKGDNSPVTEVDKECEHTIIDIVAKHFPRDGFLGEETGASDGPSGRCWVIDPLDGTRPYIRGIPTHSVLLALQEDEKVVVGVMVLPSLNLVLWASYGNGAFCNGDRIHVSKTTEVDKVFGSAFGFVEKFAEPQGQHLLSAMRAWNYSYGFMDAYSYACVAMGRMDATISLIDKPWDSAAPFCIIREAGGTVTDIAGSPSFRNGTTVATNGCIHDAVLKYFQ